MNRVMIVFGLALTGVAHLVERAQRTKRPPYPYIRSR
jgi:hypothetical protein